LAFDGRRLSIRQLHVCVDISGNQSHQRLLTSRQRDQVSTQIADATFPFERLPTELRLTVFEFIRLPKDLWNCVLVSPLWLYLIAGRVCRSFRDMPLGHRRRTSAADMSLVLLKPSHAIIGPPPVNLQKCLPDPDVLPDTIRRVKKVDLSKMGNVESDPRWLMSLLQILQDHRASLTSFTAPTVLLYPQFLQLFHHQKALRMLEMNQLRSITQTCKNQDYTAMLASLDHDRLTIAPSLAKLEEMSLCISNEQRDHNAGIFLAAMLTQEAPKLKKLSLRYVRIAQRVIRDVLRDSSLDNRPGPQPRPYPTPTQLSHLQLNSIDLFDRNFRLYP
jgi:hypothetical protein